MATATLLVEDVSHFCPVTNFYGCSDGRWFLVTVASIAAPDEAATELFGIRVPVRSMQIPTRTAVFLADADMDILDADGDPSNGVTPYATFEDIDTHDAAIAALGYELIGDH